MFDIIRKPFLWQAWDRKLQEEVGQRHTFHLKSIQDLVIYDHLRSLEGKKIAEIGGGNSRILAKLATRNDCYNIEKFEGQGGGPVSVIDLPGVTNIPVFLGEHSGKLEKDFFDVVFSISVIEHVPNKMLADFVREGISILKPGGLWLHAIDIYIEDQPSERMTEKFNIYRDWLALPGLDPVGRILEGPLKFTCDMATNPDNVMYEWGKIVPSLIPLRQKAQSVSILMAAKRV